jgi:hypothetical protein
MNESAISSLALGAEEDFGGRKSQDNLVLPDVDAEAEEAEGEDADADGRTQHQSKGAGASSSSERGTYKARSRRSAKSDSKERDGTGAKKRRQRRRINARCGAMRPRVSGVRRRAASQSGWANWKRARRGLNGARYRDGTWTVFASGTVDSSACRARPRDTAGHGVEGESALLRLHPSRHSQPGTNLPPSCVHFGPWARAWVVIQLDFKPPPRWL